jgi:putative membrane protein
LTESKLLAIIGLFSGTLAFAAEILDEAVFEWVDGQIKMISGQISQWQLMTMILIALAFIVGFYLIANAVSILFAVVRFYNFRASRQGNNIHIEYGLLTAKSYTLPVKNIHAVIISQNLSRQILRFCSVELVSIGYGDEKNEVALLIPLIRLAQLEKALSMILPEYQGNLALQPAPRVAARRFLLIPLLLVIFTVLIISQFWVPIWYSLLILLPWVAVSRWLNYRNAGIGYNGDRLEIRNGGFTRKRSRIRLNAVQSVAAHSHPFMERSGLKSYRVDYHAPALRSVVHVRFLEEKHLDALRQLLDQSEET